ncbi:MAG: hypothetical protein EBR82_36245 [Caulobacteraceae bacterium]|nr:hypothetical protein [Caulobacteraceae bacterium]
MASSEGKKFKKPHSVFDFQVFQDRVAKIEQKLREIREEMATHDIQEIEVMSGTFSSFVERIGEIVEDWRSAATKEVGRMSMVRARERYEKMQREKKGS